MTYNSDIEFETGVPVANTIPLPPVISAIYRHLINRSADLFDDEVLIPATRVILCG